MGKEFLIVIDMQNDFVTGSLGSEDARATVNNVVRVIEAFKNKEIVFTADTHAANYAADPESKTVSVPHCIEDTNGWLLVPSVARFVSERTPIIRKSTFGIVDWRKALLLRDYHWVKDLEGASFTLCGLCTDICVVSNALSLRASFPGSKISVVRDACAGTSPEAHVAALKVMQSVGINIVDTEDIA